MGIVISDAAAAWAEQLAAQGLKEATVGVYRRDLDNFVEFFGGDKDVSAITLLKINGYVKSNRLLKSSSGKVLAAQTLKRARRVCRMFLEWLQEAGHAPELPAGAINVLKS